MSISSDKKHEALQQYEQNKRYRICYVPMCKKTNIKYPDKLFIHVPKALNRRKLWLRLARRDPEFTSDKSTIFFCEDHFDLPNDMENYIQYKIMGSVSKIRIKPDCLPSRFDCQPDRVKRTAPLQPPSPLSKRRRMDAIHEIFSEESDLTKSDSQTVVEKEADFTNNVQDKAEQAISETCNEVQVLTSENSRSEDAAIVQTNDQDISPLKSNATNEVSETGTPIEMSGVQPARSEFRVDPKLKTYAKRTHRKRPYELKVCRICFETDCVLHQMNGNEKLYKGYEDVTGVKLADKEDLPRYLCTSCADQLINCASFRHRSLQAHLVLLDILKTHDHITLESIRTFKRTQTSAKYDNDTEHTVNETTLTSVQNDESTTIALHGIKTEINDPAVDCENVNLDIVKSEFNDLNITCEDLPLHEIRKEINDFIRNCEDLPLNEIKREINDLNINCEETIDGTQTEISDLNINCQNSIVDEIKREINDLNINCEETRDGTQTEISDLNINCQNSVVDEIKSEINDLNISCEDNAIDGIQTDISDLNIKCEDLPPNEIKTEINDANIDCEKVNQDVLKTANEITIECERIAQEISNLESDDVMRVDKRKEITIKDVINSSRLFEEVFIPSSVIKDSIKKDVIEESAADVVDGELDTAIDALDDDLLAQEDEIVKAAREETEESNDIYVIEVKEMSERENSDKLFIGDHTYACDYRSDNDNGLSDDDKPFRCNVCKKSFIRKCNLDIHSRVHTGHKPYKCNICNETFNRKGSLNEHVLKHADKKSLLCHICNKSFTRKKTFDNHLKIHKGNKTYTCVVCDKSFSLNAYLRKHMLIHSCNS